MQALLKRKESLKKQKEEENKLALPEVRLEQVSCVFKYICDQWMMLPFKRVVL